MKTIKLKSKLSEDEVLKKVKSITDTLREKGVLAKGDELVAGIDEEGDSVIVTINGDIMDKAKYAELKKNFLEIGEVIANDLKNFDEEPENPDKATDPDPKSETPKSTEEKESKETAVSDQAVKPAVETYHDTSELLITENLNNKKMDNLKTLLFSEEELKESKETPAVEEKKPEEVHHDEEKKPEEPKKEEKPAEEPKVEEPKSEEKKPEEKTFDEEKEVKFRVKCAKSGEVLKEGMIKVDAKCSKVDAQAKVLKELDGLKEGTVLEFFSEDEPEMKTFDDLYFSKEEIENSPKAEPEKKEEKPTEAKPEEEKKPEEVHHDETKPEAEQPKVEEPKKEDPKPAEPEKKEEAKPEETLHDEMKPEEKAATLKSVAEYLRKAEQGKTLSVAEKYFCDSMTKYFTEDEVKKAVEDVAKAEADKKPEDEKIEVSKKEFDDMKAELEAKTAKVKELEEAAKKAAEVPEKKESKDELLARLNEEKGGKDLISLAKKHKNEIK